MPLLMSQGEYAKRQGVLPSAVSNWKKRGLLVFAEDPKRPGKQLVDVEKTDLLVRGTIDQTRGRPRAVETTQASAPQAETPAPRAVSGLEAARLDEMQERTRRRRIETEQLLGKLVPIAEYERRAGDLGRLIRERTNALVRNLAERLAAETEPRAVIAVLGEAFDHLFDQVANEIEAEAEKEREVDQELAPLALDDEDGAEE